jgi:tRNA G18 (ribose-2'-O)-methylase SpoU
MGHALRIPHATWNPEHPGIAQLQQLGYTTIALDPHPDAPPLDGALATLPANPRIALVVGHEGEGLSEHARRDATTRARIPMAPATDSLNTATATGIALHAAANKLGLLQPRTTTVRP